MNNEQLCSSDDNSVQDQHIKLCWTRQWLGNAPFLVIKPFLTLIAHHGLTCKRSIRALEATYIYVNGCLPTSLQANMLIIILLFHLSAEHSSCRGRLNSLPSTKFSLGIMAIFSLRLKKGKKALVLENCG